MTIAIEQLIEVLHGGPEVTVRTKAGSTFTGRFIDTGSGVIAVELVDREVVLLGSDSLDYYTFYVPEVADDDAD